MKVSKQLTARPSAKRECHNCPLNGKQDDYCWKKCLGPAENSGKGISTVTLGGMDAPDEFIQNNADRDFKSADTFLGLSPSPSSSRPTPVTASLDYEVERSLVQVLATVMSLSDIQLCLFRHIYNGENLALAGRNCIRPMSRQAASKHIKAIRRANPVIAKVIKQLVWLPDDEDTGKKADNKAVGEAVQLDLFGEPLKQTA